MQFWYEDIKDQLTGSGDTLRFVWSKRGLVRVVNLAHGHDLSDAMQVQSELVHRFPALRLLLGGGRFQSEMVATDIQGTEFQRTVWHAIAQIPSGQTISYRELATRAGRPDAIRAVASACGANPLPLVIPCHRVIASDGSLGGFIWGLPYKQALLEREQAALHPLAA
jgi:AraC family transcriptional regulator of adaptative response/methylated-DNA-[protein]-cysteine methyltransferase